MHHAPEAFDLTIIGSGPVGLYAAYYAGFRRLRTKLIDSLDRLGGQVTALYPEKHIYDVPGFPSVTGKALVDLLQQQVQQYQPEVCLRERAERLARETSGLWRIDTDTASHFTRALLIAGGIGLFTPRRYGRPEIDRYEWKGLSYVMADLGVYRNQRVIITGGGDSAVDWALHLNRLASHVTLVHRRDEFRAHEDLVVRLRECATVRVFTELKALHGDGRVEAATLKDLRSGEQYRVPCDAVLACLGFLANPGPIEEWGLETCNDGIAVNIRMESSLPGVYAAGDMAQYPGKPRLISVGFGEAAVAINNAAVFVDPQRKIFPGHSSNMDKLPAPRLP